MKTFQLHIKHANTLFTRMRGLLGTPNLPEGHAMLIERCRAIHTVGMRFALDVFFIDREGYVVRIARDVPPGRLCVAGGNNARRCVEFAATDIYATQITLHSKFYHTPDGYKVDIPD